MCAGSTGDTALPRSYEKLLKGCSHQRGVFHACRSSNANLSSEMTRNLLKEIKKRFPASQTLKPRFGKQVAAKGMRPFKELGLCATGPSKGLSGGGETACAHFNLLPEDLFLPALRNGDWAGDEYEFSLPVISSTDCTQNLHLKCINDSKRATREPDFKRPICCPGFNECAPQWGPCCFAAVCAQEGDQRTDRRTGRGSAEPACHPGG